MALHRIVKRILIGAGILLLIIAGGLYYIYSNLNQILTNSLNNGFQSNIISDVYALKFDGLDVNILTGSVKVLNVTMYPLEKPVQRYDYINSTFRLEAQKMILKNVNLVKLIRTNKLDLKKIELIEPGIDFEIADEKPVFFPFTQSVPDTTRATKNKKRSIESYYLEAFMMKDAYFNVINHARKRNFDIKGINLSLDDIRIERQPSRDHISYKRFNFSIGELTGNLESKNLRYIYFKDFKVDIDSLQLEDTPDTIMYTFADIKTGIKNLDIQTKDSLFHIMMESFELSYRKKSIEFNNLSLKPNITDAAMQKRFAYRKEHFAADIKSIKVHGLDFDSLLFAQKILIKEILLDKVNASIFKDLRKPFPPDHRPVYLGQQINQITKPVTIETIKISELNLVNTEITPDGNTGKANINRGMVEIKNLSNRTGAGLLTIYADAYIENTAHTSLRLDFDYAKPQFSMQGRLNKFDLADLNALTNSYAPARIKRGIVDEITFSGMVYEKRSSGQMKFLYHDLVIDFELVDKAKWKSTVLGFAANTYLNASNPVSDKHPPKVVKFEVERDMRKGWLSMVIKSLMDGVKETFVMSKENKQDYKEAKKAVRQANKKKKK
jgi:hypothetical protein